MQEGIIQAVVSHYIELDEKGEDTAIGLCPFHSEKTPSFTVYKDSGKCYCFGCSWQGDAIDFVRELDGVGLQEAKEKIEAITGETISLASGAKNTGKEDSKPGGLPSEAIKKFQADKIYQSLSYRSIRKEVDEYYKVLSKVRDGQVVARYYPETAGPKLMGYKCRNHPKNFTHGKVGVTGVKNDLFGQWRFRSGGKYVLIVGGEEDVLAAYQMFLDYQKSKGENSVAPIPVVSPTAGEGAAAKQCAQQYAWLDSYENIVIGLDNDTAGEEATKKLAEVLPKEKVKIASWFNKDPSKMLQNGQAKQFLRDFYNSKNFVKTSVITSKEADLLIEEEVAKEKIPLPPFLSTLTRIAAGGFPLGYIINLIAATGIGKTTIINELIRYWIYNSPHKIGVMSLELNAGQYMVAMLSREVGRKISLIEDPQEALSFVKSPEVMKARQRLREHEHGEERFTLLDDRDGDLDTVTRQCDQLFNKYNCKVLVIDPLQDAIESSPMEEQLKFIKWMKSRTKDGYTFINICHVRKSQSTTNNNGKRVNRQLSEDDVHGISSIVKSAGANIFMSRDQYAEDDIDRNTTLIEVGKCRWTGNTGPGGELYYDNYAHTLHDKNEYFSGENSSP